VRSHRQEALDTVSVPCATRWDGLLLALLAVSLLLNLILAAGFLRLSIPGSGQQEQPPKVVELPVGSQAPALEILKRPAGLEAIRFDAEPRPTVVYIASASCPWCERNLTSIRTLFSATSPSFRFVGILLGSGSEDYAKDKELGFTFYAPSPKAIAAYRMSGTPHTYVISPAGQILKSWRGAYAETVKQEIQEYFHVDLPGLPPLR
jgi:hypothetical protein